MKLASNVALFVALSLIIVAFASRQPNARERDAIRLHAKAVADFNDCDTRKEECLAKANANPYGSDEAIQELVAARDWIRLKKQCEPNIANSQTIITEEEHSRDVRFISLISLAIISGLVGLVLKCSATPLKFFSAQTSKT